MARCAPRGARVAADAPLQRRGLACVTVGSGIYGIGGRGRRQGEVEYRKFRGVAFTEEEFLAHYGSGVQWDEAEDVEREFDLHSAEVYDTKVCTWTISSSGSPVAANL